MAGPTKEREIPYYFRRRITSINLIQCLLSYQILVTSNRLILALYLWVLHLLQESALTEFNQSLAVTKRIVVPGFNLPEIIFCTSLRYTCILQNLIRLSQKNHVPIWKIRDRTHSRNLLSSLTSIYILQSQCPRCKINIPRSLPFSSRTESFPGAVPKITYAQNLTKSVSSVAEAFSPVIA